MSDILRASKAPSKSSSAPSKSSSTPDTGVFPARSVSGASPARTPMRPASGFSSAFGSDEKKASWDDLSRERDPDGETKNYSVPPELIALARASGKARDEHEKLTPLAPKPPHEVVVVVPAAPPLTLELQAAGELGDESSLQAPSVPIPLEGSSQEPESARAPVYGADPIGAASPEPSESAAAGAAPQLAEMMRSELAAAEADESPASEWVRLRPSSRRARRSSGVSLPEGVSAAARAAAPAEPPLSNGYLTYVAGGALVGVYVLLCYYANAWIAGLP